MKSQQEIKAQVERSIKAITLRPAVGRITRKTEAQLMGGLVCSVKDGDWSLTSDVVEMLGGNQSAPSPSVLGRMALGSCLAIGYGMWFSQKGIPYQDIRVEVEGDLDFGGMLGLDDTISPTHDSFRIRVAITSDAPTEDIESTVELVERYSPILQLVKRPTPVERVLTVSAPVPNSPA